MRNRIRKLWRRLTGRAQVDRLELRVGSLEAEVHGLWVAIKVVTGKQKEN
jgi:hypothetical protein